MAVMGHHGPLLPLYFAKRILTTVHFKHLQLKRIRKYFNRNFHNRNPIEITTAATGRSAISYFPILEINPLEIVYRKNRWPGSRLLCPIILKRC